MVLDIKQLNFGETILGLQQERKKLQGEQSSIGEQIQVIDQTIESLIFLGNPEARMPLPRKLDEMGLQDAVRALLRRSYPIYLLPTDIRDTLLSAGAYHSSYKNLLISIHTAISRMEPALETESRPGGKTAYRWKSGETLKNAYEQALDHEMKRRKIRRSPLGGSF